MKKIILLGCLFIGLNITTQAQVYGEGTSIISAGYGVPNMLTLRFNVLDVDIDRTVTPVGPAYLKYEYVATDLVSVGITMAYARTKIDYQIDYVDQNNQVQTGREGCTISNFGAYADINFYWLRAGRVAFYSGIGAGFNHFGYDEYSDDPYFQSSNFGNRVRNSIPLGLQATMVGAKFEIANGFGMYSSFGIGKSIFEIGFCYGFGSAPIDNK